MPNKTVAVFNRWLKISVGLFFMEVAIYYKDWMPALFKSFHNPENTEQGMLCSMFCS